MKSPFFKALASLFFGLFILISTTSSFAESVPWQSYSSSAFKSAKAKNKLVLVYVKSDSCHWCEQMNSETLSSPAIIQLINQKFVPVVVDIVNEKSLADQFNAYGTPTFIVLDSNRHEVSRQTGYESTNQFKSYLDSL